jgi:carboxyl-terminal processing protease
MVRSLTTGDSIMRRRALTAAVALAVLTGAATAHAQAPTEGVWRSRGYGYVVRFDAGKAKLFHAVDGVCYPDPRPEPDPDGILVVSRAIGPDMVAFSSGPADTAYVFDRLPALPKACTAKVDWTPRRITAVTAQTFEAFYPSSQARHIDWTARARIADKAAAKARNDAALYDVLAGLMDGLDDPHVGLQATLGGDEREFESGEAATLIKVRTPSKDADPAASEKAWLQAYKRGVMDDVLRGKGHQVANNRIIWGRVGGVGYLNIVTMGAFDKDGAPDDPAALDKALDEALTAFDGTKAVIVDVSNNRGGFDSISLRIAGRFTYRARLAWSKNAAGAADVVPQAFHVQPTGARRYIGPVYLVTSDVTVSAGETFTLAMRALPNVVQVGERTRGGLSDQLTKPLPNGWMLTLPAEIYRDPRGERFEAVGISPDVARPVFSGDLAEGHARMVRGLMDEIEKGTAPGAVTRD